MPENEAACSQCAGHGGRGVCPHCGDWHADDLSCCPNPRVADPREECEGGFPGCCDACHGTGYAANDPCSDCYATGHPHPPAREPDPTTGPHEPRAAEKAKEAECDG